MAYRPGLVIANPEGSPLTHRYTGPDRLEPGEGARIVADLPVSEPAEQLQVWIEWEDGRGLQRLMAYGVEGSRPG